MADERGHSEGKLLKAVCGVFLGLALYALGLGPAKKLAFAGYLPRNFVDMVYQPLNLLNGTPLESVRIWYLQLWFPPAYSGDILEAGHRW